MQCLLHTLAKPQLLLDSLVDKHVGINSRTQCQHDTGDTRHGQCRLERSKHAQREEEVGNQRQIGHHARDDVVHDDHVEHQQDKGNDKRDETLLDRLGTERRTYDFLLNNLCRSRHTARLQRVGQVLGILDGEVAPDRRLTAINLTVDTGS